MGEFIRNRLPDPVAYFESEGLQFTGRGKWRTTRCDFHGGSDSLRVNTESGGWVCMACGAKGGNVLDFYIRAHGIEFVEAAKALGAYVDDGKPDRGRRTATTLSARDAMEVMVDRLGRSWIVISDIRRGVIPNDSEWQAFLECVGLIETLVAEYRA